jgi:hypothetical protein
MHSPPRRPSTSPSRPHSLGSRAKPPKPPRAYRRAAPGWVLVLPGGRLSFCANACERETHPATTTGHLFSSAHFHFFPSSSSSPNPITINHQNPPHPPISINTTPPPSPSSPFRSRHDDTSAEPLSPLQPPTSVVDGPPSSLRPPLALTTTRRWSHRPSRPPSSPCLLKGATPPASWTRCTARP